MNYRSKLFACVVCAFFSGAVSEQSYQQLNAKDWTVFTKLQRPAIQKIGGDLDYLKTRADELRGALLVETVEGKAAASAPFTISLDKYPKPIQAEVVLQTGSGKSAALILLVDGQFTGISFSCPASNPTDGGALLSINDGLLILKTGCHNPVSTTVNVLYSR
jgi:hypothetical protein